MKKLKKQENVFSLEKNGRAVFQSGKVCIRCESGRFWITWPWSGDIVLEEGNELEVNTRGIISIRSVGENACRIRMTVDKSADTAFKRTIRYLFMTVKSTGAGRIFSN